MDSKTYYYAAELVRVVDGDTFRLSIDLGFDIWLRNVSVRLLGVDTPEIKGSEKERGLIVRDIVEKELTSSDGVIIKTYKNKQSGKYGRWLAEVYLKKGSNFISLGEWLIRNGYAEVWPHAEFDAFEESYKKLVSIKETSDVVCD